MERVLPIEMMGGPNLLQVVAMGFCLQRDGNAGKATNPYRSAAFVHRFINAW